MLINKKIIIVVILSLILITVLIVQLYPQPDVPENISPLSGLPFTEEEMVAVGEPYKETQKEPQEIDDRPLKVDKPTVQLTVLNELLEQKLRQSTLQIRLSDQPSIWLFKAEFESKDYSRALIHLDTMLETAQYEHVSFIGSYLRMITGCILWISQNEPQERRNAAAKALGIIIESEAEYCCDNELIEKLSKLIKGFLGSARQTSEQINKLLRFSAIRCIQNRFEVNRQILADSASQRTVHDFPDVSYLQRMREKIYQKDSSRQQIDGDDLKKSWLSNKLPYCVEGQRYNLTGRTWGCSRHLTSDRLLQEMDDKYKNAFEELAKFVLCNPDFRPIRYNPVIVQPVQRVFHRTHPW